MLVTTCEAREKSFLLNMTILDFLASINGVAYLLAVDGQFLGTLSTDRYDPNSISNRYGEYGGRYGTYSISNPYGDYGSRYGNHSPYNNHSLTPPVVVYQGQGVLVVSKNPNFRTNGVPVIDPDFLLSVYTPPQNSNSYLIRAATSGFTGWV